MELHEDYGSMNLFFDLDGTLLDSRERLYQLFQALVPQSTFSFSAYWDLKRFKNDHKTILSKFFGFNDKGIKNFEKIWMSEIEDDRWLLLDRPFPGVTDYLITLKDRGCSLYLTTSRQFRDKVLKQIEDFQWESLFTGIYVTEQKISKSELLSRFRFYSDCWLIGDTGYDIIEGKKLNFKTVGIYSGFLTKEKLEEYNPDFIYEKVTEFMPDQIVNNSDDEHASKN